MKIIAIISLIVFLYAIGCIIKEIVKTMKCKSDIGQHHLESHLSILFMLLITSLSLIGWLFHHKGIKHAFDIHLIKESFWGFILLISYTITSITRHFRKERTGADFVLNIKEELKYKK